MAENETEWSGGATDRDAMKEAMLEVLGSFPQLRSLMNPADEESIPTRAISVTEERTVGPSGKHG